jgi:peptidoglycan/LPS O-acetylase OafA/YrhL
MCRKRHDTSRGSPRFPRQARDRLFAAQRALAQDDSQSERLPSSGDYCVRFSSPVFCLPWRNVATHPVSPAPLNLAYSSSSSNTRVAPDWSKRIPALDGLRGIAILLVLMRHGIFGLESSSRLVNRLLTAGQLTWSGVDLFFVLSGFLIGGILLDARASPRYYTTFYARRAYRILPLYFGVTLVFLLRHLPVRFLHGALGDTSPLTIPWASYLTFTQNFFMAHLGWFGPTAMVVTWSLAVEEQFYLVIPLVIRKTRGDRLVWAMAFVFIAAAVLRLMLRSTLAHGDFACYILMPCRADSLCLGVLSAYLVRQPAFWNQLMKRRKLLWSTSGILFAGIAYMTARHYDNYSLPMTTWGYPWLALFYTSCLLTAVSSAGGVWHGILCNPLLMRLGTLAYCTYLLHYPLIQAGRQVFEVLLPSHPEAAFLAGGLLAIAITLVVAALSWRFFEQPMLRRGHKYQYF